MFDYQIDSTIHQMTIFVANLNINLRVEFYNIRRSLCLFGVSPNMLGDSLDFDHLLCIFAPFDLICYNLSFHAPCSLFLLSNTHLDPQHIDDNIFDNLSSIWVQIMDSSTPQT